MRFRIRGTGTIDRSEIALMLAMIVQADSRWQPYMPNDKDDFWTLDRANDWKLSFPDGYSRECEVSHRYGNSGFDQELFAYISKRMRWDMLTE